MSCFCLKRRNTEEDLVFVLYCLMHLYTSIQRTAMLKRIWTYLFCIVLKSKTSPHWWEIKRKTLWRTLENFSAAVELLIIDLCDLRDEVPCVCSAGFLTDTWALLVVEECVEAGFVSTSPLPNVSFVLGTESSVRAKVKVCGSHFQWDHSQWSP